MRPKLAIATAIAALAVPAFAHRLDEYLQATILSVEPHRVQGSTRLIPGVAVSGAVIASIDSDGDGKLSQIEQQVYAQHVLRDLLLSVDGHRLTPVLLSMSFPTTDAMKEGLGEIHIDFAADLPSGPSTRALVLENHHDSAISAYLMNCLVPQDRDIRIMAQSRNQNQSYYRVDYSVSEGEQDSLLLHWRSSFLARFAALGAFPSMFHLGMRHIAEGTDHLLFLLALLLPAPLLAVGRRWTVHAEARHGLIHILRIVTAFTAGHSVTLMLAAMGFVHAPSRPVEELIAFSILVSAAHAFRPLFPGREAVIAALFGLIHGLAFATTLRDLGLGRWERIVSIFGFNLGIETMQLLVVAGVLPSLLMLSRTRAYTALRVAGALFAGFASLGWIAERLLHVQTSVDVLVTGAAHHAVWIASLLFVSSAVCWWHHQIRTKRTATIEPRNNVVGAVHS